MSGRVGRGKLEVVCCRREGLGAANFIVLSLVKRPPRHSAGAGHPTPPRSRIIEMLTSPEYRVPVDEATIQLNSRQLAFLY
jgi:hypothetical protein